MNTKALVAVIAFVAAASAMAQFKSEDTQVASMSLGNSANASVTTGFGFDNAGRTKVRLGTAVEASLSTANGSGSLAQRSIDSERLSFPAPGNFAMLLAGLGVIGFIARRRQQG